MLNTPQSVRLFIAVYPPPDVGAQMTELVKSLHLAPCRRVDVEKVHMTVLFLGDRPASQRDAIAWSMRDAAAGIGPITLTPQRLTTFSARRDPRLIALECTATPNLHTLYARLVADIIPRCDRPVRDTLVPHFTLVRFARSAHASREDLPIALPPFAIREIALMRSDLLPHGASHTQVAAVPIG